MNDQDVDDDKRIVVFGVCWEREKICFARRGGRYLSMLGAPISAGIDCLFSKNTYIIAGVTRSIWQQIRPDQRTQNKVGG